MCTGKRLRAGCNQGYLPKTLGPRDTDALALANACRSLYPDRVFVKWGDKLAFRDAIDTQPVLPHGTVAEVEAEVEQRIEEPGPGGGYVLSAVHDIQPDVPLENVLAMYRHARPYRPSFGESAASCEC